MSQKFGAFVYLSCLLLSISFLSLEKVNAQEFQEHFRGPNGGAGFNSGIYHTPFYYFVGQYVDSTRRTHTIAYKVHPDGRRLDSLDIAFPNANTFNGWYSSSFWSIAEDRLVIVGGTWDSIKKNTLMVIKADKDLVPTDTMDLPGLDTGQSIYKGIEDSDSSYVLIGFSTKQDSANADMMFMRVKHDGTILTEQFYGSPRGDAAFAIDTIPGGGYYLAGESLGMGSGNGQYPNIVVYRLDTAYQIVWRKIIGNYYPDYVYDLSTTPDSGCVIGGLKNTDFTGVPRGLPYIAKYSFDGVLEWDSVIGNTPADGGIYGLEVIECGDILGTGMQFDTTMTDRGLSIVFRCGPNGIFRSVLIDSGNGNGAFFYRDIRLASNEGVVLAGITYPHSGPHVNENLFCIRKMDSIASLRLCRDEDSVNTHAHSNFGNSFAITIYPNPSSGVLNFTSNTQGITNFEIYTIDGRLLKKSSFESHVLIETNTIGKGVFIVRFIYNEQEVHASKLIIQ